MNEEKLEEIYESLKNGQRRQMVEQIDAYGVYDFWEDFSEILEDSSRVPYQMDWYKDAVCSYFRIKYR